ncbi:MAG: succinylglutamate desuccinylase [Alteromonadaceae bacterium]|nr:succinylglutamate desuccinylase [Alteromonadaceae bacterium]MBH86920.1 succinylglutamate desuccinylase [Alteromonadaceae bacterium]
MPYQPTRRFHASVSSTRLLALLFSLSSGLLLYVPAASAEPAKTERPYPVELSEDESVEDIDASQLEPTADAGAAEAKSAPETTGDDPVAGPPENANKPKETATMVAPDVDLKEVAPPPQAAPVTESSPDNDLLPENQRIPTVSLPEDSSPPVAHDPESAAKPDAPGTDATDQTDTPAETSTAPDTQQPTPETTSPEKPASPATPDDKAPAETATTTPAPAKPAPKAEPLVILGAEVRPGTSTRLAWTPDISISGLASPTPVLVINGAQPGPNLCMTGAVHGDELNGIEIIRRVMYDIEPDELSGRVIGVPIVNVQGFQRGSRYLPDRRDLNRNFPGDPNGSLAGRIAYSLFNDVIRHCDMLVDIHTGSLKRSNLAQLRADMHIPEVAEFTRGFDKMAVVHSQGTIGMLRSAATDNDIVAVTMEAGESLRIQENQIEAGVNSINSLLEKQGMISRLFVWGKPEPVYYNSSWIRTNVGGILVSDVELGDEVAAGEVLGIVTDPITNAQHPIKAKRSGRIIGMAVDQVVMAGFATYHLGSEARGPEER